MGKEKWKEVQVVIDDLPVLFSNVEETPWQDEQ